MKGWKWDYQKYANNNIEQQRIEREWTRYRNLQQPNINDFIPHNNNDNNNNNNNNNNEQKENNNITYHEICCEWWHRTGDAFKTIKPMCLRSLKVVSETAEVERIFSKRD